MTDANTIAKLSSQLGYNFPADKTAHQIAAINASSFDAAFAAVADNTIVGWIHVFYAIRLECDLFCEIGGLVTDEGHRGSGVGKLLVAKAKEWCIEKGCSLLRVRSNARRTEAHNFYKHLGFNESKLQKVFELHL